MVDNAITASIGLGSLYHGRILMVNFKPGEDNEATDVYKTLISRSMDPFVDLVHVD